MTQAQPQTPPDNQKPGDDDPLSHLHKMSITAGLGSGEYIAVNGAAVAAILLGLASALALMNELLLIIPFAGIIVSIVAIRQIRRSNGTQTGIGLVILGLVLMVIFGGYVSSQKVIENIRTRDDRAAISKTVAQLGELCKAGKYQDAYELFSQRFHEHVKPLEFVEKIKFLGDSGVYGKLKGARAGLMEFPPADEATGDQYALVRVLFEFEKTDKPLPDDLYFKKEGNQWHVESFKSLFPPPTPPR